MEKVRDGFHQLGLHPLKRIRKISGSRRTTNRRQHHSARVSESGWRHLKGNGTFSACLSEIKFIAGARSFWCDKGKDSSSNTSSSVCFGVQSLLPPTILTRFIILTNVGKCEAVFHFCWWKKARPKRGKKSWRRQWKVARSYLLQKKFHLTRLHHSRRELCRNLKFQRPQWRCCPSTGKRRTFWPRSWWMGAGSFCLGRSEKQTPLEMEFALVWSLNFYGKNKSTLWAWISSDGLLRYYFDFAFCRGKFVRLWLDLLTVTVYRAVLA